MDSSGKRIVGSLLLLLGLTFLIAGLASGQLEYLFDFLSKVFTPSVAGVP